MKKGFWERIANVILENYIIEKKKHELARIQNIIMYVSSGLVSTIAYISAILTNYLLVIALAILGSAIFVYLVLDHAIKLIDDGISGEVEKLKSSIDSLNIEKCDLEKKIDIITKKFDYASNLYAESMAIQKAIVRANKINSSGQLYTTFTQAIITTMEQFRITRENYQISIYGYDGNTREVCRLDVESYVKTKQTPSSNRKHSVDDERIKRFYYAKALTSQKTYFLLKDNEEIKKNLYFDEEDEEVVKQYSQYVGMSCKIDEKRKLYVEIIAYNDLKFDSHINPLSDFSKKVIAPYSTLFASVNWEHVRRDLDG